MRQERILQALTRLLHVASYMDKRQPLGLIANLVTIQSLAISEATYKCIDYSNYQIMGHHTFLARFLPNYVIGAAFFDTSKKLVDSSAWTLLKNPYVEMLDKEFVTHGFSFIDNVLYLSIADDQKVTQSWPSQMAFIQNSPVKIPAPTDIKSSTDIMVSA